MPRGYPKLAAFLDSDENFMIYRRFSYLMSRLLVEKQNDLQLLEDKLDRQDRDAVDEDPNCLMGRFDYNEERKNLMSSIEKKWHEYCKLISPLPCSRCSSPKQNSSSQLKKQLGSNDPPLPNTRA
jgi:hypothetical protein